MAIECYPGAVHPVVRAALAVSLLSAGSSLSELGSAPHAVTIVRSRPADSPDDLSALCPEGQLPDVSRCVPVPDRAAETTRDPLSSSVNAHRDRDGQWRVYEQIPRRPDRPADYAAYQFPIPGPPGGKLAVSGYDLDRPDPEQRRGASLKAVGHGGIDLVQARGTEVRLVALEGQQGDAEVEFVGDLFGNTVVTRHAVMEAGRTRDYVVLYGHLQSSAPGLAAGMKAPAGTMLGFVGDSGSEGKVHLHLEVRQVRDGVDPADLRGTTVVQPSVTIVCDPRNVLPLATP